ncbi:MAG: PEP/pyruvate-binding domain-containing protein, partial [Pseudomonadota bacterium]
MTLFLDWEGAFRAGPGVVGGKAWNLARLARYGFRVPAGGVLTTEGCRLFVARNGFDFTAPMPEEISAALAQGVARLGLGDCWLAVRSSAVGEDSASASFAGILDSVLNIAPGPDLLLAVRKCWNSAFSARAIGYRARMGIEAEDAFPAVVVMAMAEAECAGVAFSCDPRTGREDRVFISANFGLGETVVGGRVDPDEYCVNVGFHSPDYRIEERRIGRKELVSRPAAGGGTKEVTGDGSGRASMPDKDLLRLARLVVRVKDALGSGEVDQDVEWVWNASGFWLVQARPVTTRPLYTYDALRGEPTLWTNGNIRDSLPMQIRPLAWSLATHGVQAILESFHRVTGYPFLPGLTRFSQHRGRGYLNMSVMQWEFLDGLGFAKEQTNRLVGGHQRTVSAQAPSGLRHRLRRLVANLRVARALGPARRSADRLFADIRAKAESQRRRDWSVVSARSLVDEIAALLRDFAGMDRLHLLQSSSASTFLVLSALLGRYCRGQGDSLAQALLIDRAPITSAQHGIRLAELATLANKDPEAVAYLARRPIDPTGWRQLPFHSPFRIAMGRFLEEFGHRSVYELDIGSPRWREDQAWLLDTIAGMVDGAPLADLATRRRRTQEQAWKTVRANVPRPLHGLIRRMARQSAMEAAQREMAKSSVVRVHEVMRLVVGEIASRLVKRGILSSAEDVQFLTFEDLRDLAENEWDGSGAAALVVDRRAIEAARVAEPPPDVFEDAAPRHAAPSRFEMDGKMVLRGLGVAAGVAEGTARLVEHPDAGGRLGQGDVLLAPSTDPGWTPLFLRASALVTETGGFV